MDMLWEMNYTFCLIVQRMSFLTVEWKCKVSKGWHVHRKKGEKICLNTAPAVKYKTIHSDVWNSNPVNQCFCALRVTQLLDCFSLFGFRADLIWIQTFLKVHLKRHFQDQLALPGQLCSTTTFELNGILIHFSFNIFAPSFHLIITEGYNAISGVGKELKGAYIGITFNSWTKTRPSVNANVASRWTGNCLLTRQPLILLKLTVCLLGSSFWSFKNN